MEPEIDDPTNDDSRCTTCGADLEPVYRDQVLLDGSTVRNQLREWLRCPNGHQFRKAAQ